MQSTSMSQTDPISAAPQGDSDHTGPSQPLRFLCSLEIWTEDEGVYAASSAMLPMATNETGQAVTVAS